MADLNMRFEDIDKADVCARYLGELIKPQTHSFLVEFNDNEAHCALNPKKEELKLLLQEEGSPTRKARWINFYGGDLNREHIELLAVHYNLSHRFAGLLCLEPPDSSPGFDGGKGNARDAETASFFCKDVEMGFCDNDSHYHTIKEPTPAGWSDMVNDIMHFYAIDVGPGVLCVRHNSLYPDPGKGVDLMSGEPAGKRVFTALVLCDDGTVISATERPHIDLSICGHEILQVVRWHTRNIFRHLSKSAIGNPDSLQSENQLQKVTIRKNTALAERESGQGATALPGMMPLEHASLLF